MNEDDWPVVWRSEDGGLVVRMGWPDPPPDPEDDAEADQ